MPESQSKFLLGETVIVDDGKFMIGLKAVIVDKEPIDYYVVVFDDAILYEHVGKIPIKECYLKKKES